MTRNAIHEHEEYVRNIVLRSDVEWVYKLVNSLSSTQFLFTRLHTLEIKLAWMRAMLKERQKYREERSARSKKKA